MWSASTISLLLKMSRVKLYSLNEFKKISTSRKFYVKKSINCSNKLKPDFVGRVCVGCDVVCVLRDSVEIVFVVVVIVVVQVVVHVGHNVER